MNIQISRPLLLPYLHPSHPLLLIPPRNRQHFELVAVPYLLSLYIDPLYGNSACMHYFLLAGWQYVVCVGQVTYILRWRPSGAPLVIIDNTKVCPCPAQPPPIPISNNSCTSLQCQPGNNILKHLDGSAFLPGPGAQV